MFSTVGRGPAGVLLRAGMALALAAGLVACETPGATGATGGGFTTRGGLGFYQPASDFAISALDLAVAGCAGAQAALREAETKYIAARNAWLADQTNDALRAAMDEAYRDLRFARAAANAACAGIFGGNAVTPGPERLLGPVFPPCIVVDCLPWMFDPHIRDDLFAKYRIAAGDPHPQPSAPAPLKPEIISFARQLEMAHSLRDDLKRQLETVDLLIGDLEQRATPTLPLPPPKPQ